MAGGHADVKRVTWATSLIAQEAITAGYIVHDDDTGVALLDGPTNQAATELVTPLGVALADAASGEVCDIAYAGIVEVVAGANGLAIDELVAAEYNTGKGAGETSDSLTLAAADFVIGHCVKAAAAGDKALVLLNIHEVK